MSQIKNLQYRIAQTGDAAPRKSDKTRQAILAAALKYLWTHPYRDLTVNELMAIAGSSRSAFYWYIVAVITIVNSLILYSFYHYMKLGDWLHGPGIFPYFSSVLLDSTVFLICLFVAYRIMHFLKRFKLVERIITYTSMIKYNFWRRYHPGKSGIK